MRKKILLIIIFSSISLLLFSYADYACPFLTFNQSVPNAAFGLESGAADVRHLDASSFINNPAKLGLLRGFCINYSKSDYYFAKYNIMKIAFNYKGIGISFPMYNFEDFKFKRENFGYKVIHPAQLFTDEDGNQYGAFQPVESTLSFSIGLDSSALFNSEELFFNSFNFYLGSTVNLIKSQIGPPGIGMSESSFDGIGTGTIFDFGSLVTYKPLTMQKQNSKLLFAFGSKIVVGNNMHYVNESQDDPLPQYISIGLSSDYSCYAIHPYFKEIREDYHIYGSIDLRKYSIERLVLGSGIELGYLDILAYRLGYTYYSDTGSYGISHSLGLNVVLSNGFGLGTNYLYLPDNNELGYKNRLDFSLSYTF
ncbi:MAG: hypothetical protein P9L97_06665 [Candidatus Tenebribacter davisii]|nr:hypothetical protein [Candidatus Tenebribacter davisii]